MSECGMSDEPLPLGVHAALARMMAAEPERVDLEAEYIEVLIDSRGCNCQRMVGHCGLDGGPAAMCSSHTRCRISAVTTKIAYNITRVDVGSQTRVMPGGPLDFSVGNGG